MRSAGLAEIEHRVPLMSCPARGHYREKRSGRIVYSNTTEGVGFPRVRDPVIGMKRASGSERARKGVCGGAAPRFDFRAMP